MSAKNKNMVFPIARPDIGKKEIAYVNAALKSGWISSKGKFIEEFERKFARYCGVRYGVSASNGTTALHLALLAVGITQGDEVIVPDLTYVATANVVTYCNAKPVLVDVAAENWCIDPKEIEKHITKKTRAIIAVHIYGQVCDMNALAALAKKHKLFLIEDCAEAPGAEYRGKKIGSLSDISCFSFFGNKTITTGEGGMCLTDNLELAEKIRLLRNQGADPDQRYWHSVIGYNYRLTNLQAAFGLAQVERIDALIDKKNKIYTWYQHELKELIEKKVISLPLSTTSSKSVCWLVSFLIENTFGMSRDFLMKKLEEAGIETRPFFYPLHVLPMYLKSEKFPVSEILSQKGINLPSYTDLSQKDTKIICDHIKKIYFSPPL